MFQRAFLDKFPVQMVKAVRGWRDGASAIHCLSTVMQPPDRGEGEDSEKNEDAARRAVESIRRFELNFGVEFTAEMALAFGLGIVEGARTAIAEYRFCAEQGLLNDQG